MNKLTNKKTVIIVAVVFLVVFLISSIIYIATFTTLKNKTDTIKKQAKLVGLDTNIRIAMSIIESIDQNYAVDNSGAANLEKDIAIELSKKGMINPITDSTVVASIPLNNTTRSQAVFAYISEPNESEDAKYDVNTTPDENYAGVIKYDAFVKEDHLFVKLTGIDLNGLPMTRSGTVEIY